MPPALSYLAAHKRFISLIVGCLAVIVFSALGFLYLNRDGRLYKAAKTTVDKKNHPDILIEQDVLRSRGLDITKEKGGTIVAYSEGKVVASLDIPAGAVQSPVRIALVPLKHNNDVTGVAILPATVAFKKPVTLTFDISRTTKTGDAPAVVQPEQSRITGKTQVLRYDSTTNKSSPSLIIRSNETSRLVPARILSGGTYVFTTDGSDQIEKSRSVFAEPKTSTLVVIEAASVLIGNNIPLSPEQTERVRKSVNKILGNKNVSPYEFFSASALEQQLDPARQSFLIGSVYAQSAAEGYLEYRCKDRSLSIEEYLAAASTAQLIGLDSVGDECLTAAKNRVADEARKVLGNSGASPEEIIRMMGRCQMFGLDSLSNSLEEKLRDTVKQRADDVLKDPNASIEDILKAMQDTQVSGGDDTELSQKIEQVSRQEAQQTLNDPNATFDQVIRAIQEAQAFGHEDVASSLQQRANTMLNRSSEQILDNPNATSTELTHALAQAVKEGKDMAYRNQIRDRLKEAEQREADERKNEPTPTPGDGQVDEELLVGFDSNVIWLELARGLGIIDCFSEACLKEGTDRLVQHGQELNAQTAAMCAEAPAAFAALGVPMPPELRQDCNKVESGEVLRELEHARDKAFEEAEEIGDIQSQDFEEEDFEDYHMEIEITPTDSPEDSNYEGEEYDDVQEMEYDDSAPDQSDTEFQGEEMSEDLDDDPADETTFEDRGYDSGTESSDSE